jgi:hypothetical protein
MLRRVLTSSRRIDPRAASNLSSTFRHLLIVAGPHGSGKTTFLRQLRSNELADEIRSLLPEEANLWIQTSLRKVFDESSAGRIDEGGIALHYNILRPYIRKFASFEDDPILSIMGGAEHITVVTMHAPLQRLIDQFVARSIVEQAEAPASTRLRRFVVHRLRMAGPIAATPGGEKLSGRYAKTLRLYETAGWLEARYRDWNMFVAKKTAAASTSIRPIHVEPSPGAAGGNFKLMRTD